MQLEQKVIQIFVYLIGLYTFLSGAQILISSVLFHDTFNPWILIAVGGNAQVAYLLVGAATIIGAVTLAAAYFNKRKFLLTALAATFAYQIALFILNVIEYGGRGTPAIPALILGAFAAVLYGYFSERESTLTDEQEREQDAS